MLRISNLRVLYDGVIEGARDVSMEVAGGQIVALLGANGAGKSTVLKAISGVLYSEDGEVSEGRIAFLDQDIGRMTPQQIVANGLIQVPEGRRLFDTMTVDENLISGSLLRPRAGVQAQLDKVFSLFPELVAHRKRISGLLSGGQQQMVAIGRALMGAPKLLMLDEPSLGLAPQVVGKIFETIRRLREESGLTVLIVEQNARAALQLADYAYIMDRGRVVLDGPSDRLLANDDVREFYLGLSSKGERRSMRDVKHYKRRKRWLS